MCFCSSCKSVSRRSLKWLCCFASVPWCFRVSKTTLIITSHHFPELPVSMETFPLSICELALYFNPKTFPLDPWPGAYLSLILPTSNLQALLYIIVSYTSYKPIISCQPITSSCSNPASFISFLLFHLLNSTHPSLPQITNFHFFLNKHVKQQVITVPPNSAGCLYCVWICPDYYYYEWAPFIIIIIYPHPLPIP